MRKGRHGEKKWKMEKIMTLIVATNNKRQPIGTPIACANTGTYISLANHVNTNQ